jgi:hypothetical protein
MAEAFVRTIKRDYVRLSPRPDAETDGDLLYDETGLPRW